MSFNFLKSKESYRTVILVQNTPWVPALPDASVGHAEFSFRLRKLQVNPCFLAEGNGGDYASSWVNYTRPCQEQALLWQRSAATTSECSSVGQRKESMVLEQLCFC